MSMCVCSGAMMNCTFGAAPMPLSVLPLNRVVTTSPIAVITDNKPFVNIPSFVMCSSMANPAVASATAAALGVLTPMPCVPLTFAPWSSGSSTVSIAGFPALNKESRLTCAYGGSIGFSFPGQITIQIP